MTKKPFRKSKFKALVIWSTYVLSISTVVVDVVDPFHLFHDDDDDDE